METKKAQEKQVTEQVSRLEEELTRLDGEISTLRDVLTPVLRERQLAVGKDEVEDSLLVPLADNLRNCVKKTSISALEIAEIISLLEV